MSDYPQSWPTPPTHQSDPTQSMTEPVNEKTSTVTDKATDVASETKQAAGQVAQTAGEHAQEVKDEAVRQARDLLGEARQQLNEQAGQQHRSLVSNLRSLGSELGGMAEQSSGSGVATEVVGQARDRVDSLANWLDGREPGQILDEVRSFARRRPGLFLVGALAAGMVAGRVTRGVVAAHSDDPSAAGATTGPQPLVTGTEATTGYANGGHYAAPYADQLPTTTQGYGATSTYGDAEQGGPYVGQTDPYAGQTDPYGGRPGDSSGTTAYPETEPTQNLPADGAWR
jgi:hypothetical protein